MSSKREFGTQLVALKDRVSKHFTESDWMELATLTGQDEEVDRHPRLLRSMRFGDPDYDGNVLSVLRGMIDADPENFLIIQDYLVRRFPDSENGEFVSSHKDVGRRIVFTPTVFKVPEASVDEKLVSVMMPFESGLNSVYDAIKGAASDVGIKCERADDIWIDSPVIQDVFSLIFRSFIVICDFSGKNTNVFYEAGIAHTLGKHVIPITQSAEDIPFDLRHHRFLHYLNNGEGRDKLRAKLADRIRTLSGH